MRQSIETSLAPGAGHMSHMSRPEAHRLDELSAGYSSAGCSPAAPASTFPAVSEFCNSVARKSTIFQRTVTVSLCCCLSLGVHAIVLLVAAELFVPVQHDVDLCRDAVAARPRSQLPLNEPVSRVRIARSRSMAWLPRTVAATTPASRRVVDAW